MAINLTKGSTIELTKSNGSALEHICVGLNWGSIQVKSFFGLLTSNRDVDLDGSAAIFDHDRKLLDTVYFKNLKSKDGAIRHSGDDLTGDAEGDDQKDNEVITIDLRLLNPNARTIVLFLNSYQKQDFADIPYSKVKIYEGTIHKVDEVLASFNLSADKEFAGYVSMVMGKFIKEGASWHFKAIGEPIRSTRVFDSVEEIQRKFLV